MPIATNRSESPTAPFSWLWIVFWCACGLVSARSAPITAAAERPNIVLILADDLGWSDLGCYGADLHSTPHLDRLAREGVRFTQAYAMPVCSPTRAALLTGVHAARWHYTIWREASVERADRIARGREPLIPPATIANLPHSAITLAEQLRSTGYRTYHVGKWHLGDAHFSPETQGFDVNLGGTHWGAPESYFWPFRGTNRFKEFRYVPGLGVGKPGDYLTDRLTDEALHLIDEAGNQPFFLNLWYHSPHTPIDGKPALKARFEARRKPQFHHQNPGYAAMVAALDENVGRILRRIDRRDLKRKTLVVFLSDNGGYLQDGSGVRITDNFPLRSGKGSLYEGGIRVPLLIRWPGVTRGNRVCDEPVLCTDLFQTLCAAAGVPGASGIDGRNLAPLLRDPSEHLDREALYFHYPHYYSTTSPVSAVRSGDWKLLHYYEDDRDELYDLRSDLGERNNLAKTHPDQRARLRTLLDNWLKSVDAQFPTPRTSTPGPSSQN